jgi:hypothetical protein
MLEKHYDDDGRIELLLGMVRCAFTSIGKTDRSASTEKCR